ncbi:MAG: hypothetical protein EBW87_04165 [Burkholderiaceae bacterium]|nr:hypothetical protein [Burkholderiaceae bacterium]
MPTINQLSSVDDLSGGDLFPVYVSADGDARKVSATNLRDFVLAAASVADDKAPLLLVRRLRYPPTHFLDCGLTGLLKSGIASAKGLQNARYSQVRK